MVSTISGLVSDNKYLSMMTKGSRTALSVVALVPREVSQLCFVNCKLLFVICNAFEGTNLSKHASFLVIIYS